MSSDFGLRPSRFFLSECTKWCWRNELVEDEELMAIVAVSAKLLLRQEELAL